MDTPRDDERIRQAAPLLLAALSALVRADNVNYWRDTMRYEGLFDAGRAAILAATGEDLRHTGGTRDPLIWALREIAGADPETATAAALRAIAANVLTREVDDPATATSSNRAPVAARDTCDLCGAPASVSITEGPERARLCRPCYLAGWEHNEHNLTAWAAIFDETERGC